MIKFGFPSPVILESQALTEASDQEIAMAALCDTRTACGICRGCKKVLKGFHPDWIRLSAPYKVEEMREALQRLRQHAFEAPHRLMTLSHFDTANLFVQNSLLKTFEEPLPGRILVILINSATKLVPPLRSRCFLLRDQLKANALSDSEMSFFSAVEALDDLQVEQMIESYTKDRHQFRSLIHRLLLEASRHAYPGHWRNLADPLEAAIAQIDRNLAPRAVWERAWTASLASLELKTLA